MKLFLILIALLLSTGQALACTCEPQTPAQALNKANAIFIGKATRVITSDSDPANSRLAVTVSVERYWKGVIPQEITFYVTGSFGSCQLLPFKEGESYLVYADKVSASEWLSQKEYPTLSGTSLPFPGEKVLLIGFCTRTVHVLGADEDLRALGMSRVPVR